MFTNFNPQPKPSATCDKRMKKCHDCSKVIPKGLAKRCIQCQKIYSQTRQIQKQQSGSAFQSAYERKVLPKVRKKKVFSALPACEFDQVVKDFWDFGAHPKCVKWFVCFKCGKSHADCLHHNYGRGGHVRSERLFHNSVFNSVPLNNKACHLSTGENTHSSHGDRYWLKWTFHIVMDAVRRGDFTLRQKDIEFYLHYRAEYEAIECELPIEAETLERLSS